MVLQQSANPDLGLYVSILSITQLWGCLLTLCVCAMGLAIKTQMDVFFVQQSSWLCYCYRLHAHRWGGVGGRVDYQYCVCSTHAQASQSSVTAYGLVALQVLRSFVLLSITTAFAAICFHMGGVLCTVTRPPQALLAATCARAECTCVHGSCCSHYC